MQGTWPEVVHVFVTASLGVYLLAASVQGWLFGKINPYLRAVVGVGALAMIAGGWISDVIGLGVMALAFAIQRGYLTSRNAASGMD
jgi:TRAP-type uncharacterized transport system fused permease subunit